MRLISGFPLSTLRDACRLETDHKQAPLPQLTVAHISSVYQSTAKTLSGDRGLELQATMEGTSYANPVV